jgi:hypothetical protein
MWRLLIAGTTLIWHNSWYWAVSRLNLRWNKTQFQTRLGLNFFLKLIKEKMPNFCISTLINGVWGISHQFLLSCPSILPNSWTIGYLLTSLLPNFPSHYPALHPNSCMTCYLLTMLSPNFTSPPTIRPSTQTYVLNSPSLVPPFSLFLLTLLFLFIRLRRLFLHLSS